MRSKPRIIAGLDVGTTKVCLLIGEWTEDNGIKVLGVGNQPSEGLRKGEVVNVARTVEAIGKSLAQVENLCGFEIGWVYTGITGAHIESYNSRAILPIANPSVGVTRKDKANAVEAASRVSLPVDREVIQNIPLEYAVDERSGIIDPEGIEGRKLEANVHLVTARTAAVNDIINCIYQAGLNVVHPLVFQPQASSLAVMREEERESGSLLIDIGGGTTDYIFFQNSGPHHSRVISVGGDHLTNDISLGLKIQIRQAEELKIKYGAALSEQIPADETIPISSPRSRSSGGISRRKLCRIMELRLMEIFHLIRIDLEKAGHWGNIASGLVITGGGALVPGIDLLASRETGLPVRIGLPTEVSGLREVIDSPIYSTAVGLVKYGFKSSSPRSAIPDRSGPFFGGLKRWLQRYF